MIPNYDNPLNDGRCNPSGQAWQPKRLNPRHHEILRLALLGWKNKEIAEFLGITPVAVSLALNSYAGRFHMSLLQGARESGAVDIAATLQERAPRALEILWSIIDDDATPVHTRAREAREFLGLAGHVKPQKVQVSGAVAHISSSDLEEIKRRAKLAAEESGILLPAIDAEFTELLDKDDGAEMAMQELPGPDSNDAEAQLLDAAASASVT